MSANQTELFDIASVPESPTVSCAKCKHIMAASFNNGNLFFCTAQKGGRFGKKINKNTVSRCPLYEAANDERIEVLDGYYGCLDGSVKR